MDVTFKFEIGQFVYLRQELRAWHDRYGSVEKTSESRGYQSMGELASAERRPGAVQIIERHFQQCYAATQLLYSIRVGPSLATLTEPELSADFNESAK